MKYKETVACPYCHHKGAYFKVIKEWAHGIHLVNSVVCLHCSGNFRYYWGEKKDEMKISYTIPKSMEVNSS